MNWLVTVRHHPVHEIQAVVVTSSLCDRLSRVDDLRLLCGIRDAAGERVGATVVPGEALSAVVETRNAKVGDGEGVPDAVDEGDGEGLGVGLGVGEGIMFCQRCNGTLAPPISFTRVSQRALILSKSGGPNGFSAVPGKMM